MIGELQIIFGVDPVARHLGVARQILVFFEQLGRVTACAAVDAVAAVAATAACVATTTLRALPATTATAAGLTIIDQVRVVLFTRTLGRRPPRKQPADACPFARRPGRTGPTCLRASAAGRQRLHDMDRVNLRVFNDLGWKTLAPSRFLAAGEMISKHNMCSSSGFFNRMWRSGHGNAPPGRADRPRARLPLRAMRLPLRAGYDRFPGSPPLRR